ncbi:amidohydrolase family protein [candidate division WOR-3 bacterium]|nr:amidohydrolase family protein [candidate division WOR-3 bacterium]
MINGDRITDIKDTARIPLPQGAQVVDATGKFLIPGLWDMHVHWSNDRYLPLFIANGVTGARIMWGGPTHLQWRKEIAKGSRLGPRLIIAGSIIDGPEPLIPGSISVSNETEARQVVRWVKAMGYDFVKIYSRLLREAYFFIADESEKSGIPFAGHIPMSISAVEALDSGQRSVEHLDSLIAFGVLFACSRKEEELRKYREKASEGLSLQQTLTLSQLAAFRSLSEKILETYDDDRASALFARFVRNRTWQCPTLTVLRSMRSWDDRNFINDPRLKYMPKNVRESWDMKNHPFFASNTAEDWTIGIKVYQKEFESVGAMRRVGVKLLAGTDVLNPFCFPGFSLHDELGLLVEAGLTPMQALQAATCNPAEFLGLTDSLGTVEAGKIADLVLLQANPLEDIGNTRKIAGVVFNGKFFPKTALDEILAKIETIASLTSIAEPLLNAITGQNINSAVQQYYELKATRSDTYDFSENELNSLGYRLLKMKKTREAIEIFRINVETYPRSATVYDSPAEAFVASGDRELVIKNYEKSLELNPENSNAVEALRKLTTE